jgi:hypothetical protein
VSALKAPKKVGDGLWEIKLGAEASWIEEGRQPGFQEDLLRKGPFSKSKSGPKTAADGSVYRVIPFEHMKGPSRQTPAERTLTATLKSALKATKTPYAKIERDSSNAPISGMLRSFKGAAGDAITPTRPSWANPKGGPQGNFVNNQGFGHGVPGIQKMQGPTGIPFMRGLSVYQSPLFDSSGAPKLDSKGLQKATKSAVTFRVISSKHRGAGRWDHPGLEAMGFFEKTYTWIENQWETQMLPEILKKLGVS